MKNQKSYYKSLIMTLTGLNLWVFGLILAIIFGTVFNNNILVVLLLCTSLIGFILLIIDDNVNAIVGRVNKGKFTLFYKYKLYGVPNNSKKEFKVTAKEVYFSKIIQINETDKGIFTAIINNEKIIFDLRGWHNKSYCLYEYFMSILQLDLSKKNSSLLRKSNYINIDHDVILKVFFLNGKSKKYYLIKGKKTNLSLKFKHRIVAKLEFTSYKKVSINSLYSFNE